MSGSVDEKRAYRCCFTGHRPEKIGVPKEIVCEKLGRAIDYAIGNGVVTFICGMARGIDLWAGEAVIQRKKIHPEIRLVCATPYLGFECRWSEAWQTLYARVAAQADYRVAISKQYDPSCFQRRNEWMVNHSGLVIAAYNGASGGTRNTILYAKKCGIPVYNILESTTKYDWSQRKEKL